MIDKSINLIKNQITLTKEKELGKALEINSMVISVAAQFITGLRTAFAICFILKFVKLL